MKWLAGFLGAGVVFFLILLLLILSPMIALWSLNTLSEQAHWGWYIPHNVWTYLAVYGLGTLTRTTVSTEKEKK